MPEYSLESLVRVTPRFLHTSGQVPMLLSPLFRHLFPAHCVSCPLVTDAPAPAAPDAPGAPPVPGGDCSPGIAGCCTPGIDGTLTPGIPTPGVPPGTEGGVCERDGLIQPQLTASSSANDAIGTALMIPPVVGAAGFQAALGTPFVTACARSGAHSRSSPPVPLGNSRERTE